MLGARLTLDILLFSMYLEIACAVTLKLSTVTFDLSIPFSGTAFLKFLLLSFRLLIIPTSEVTLLHIQFRHSTQICC